MEPETSGLKEESLERFDLVDIYDGKCRVGDDLSSLRFTETHEPLLSNRDLATSEIIPGNAEETLERIDFS